MKVSSRVVALVGMCVLLAGCNEPVAGLPISNAADRPMPLGFGLYVTPDPRTNPIDPPERFTGYHAALDFEVTEEEKTEDVPVFAICKGPVAFSGYAEGYGGLVLQRCKAGGQDVTILYGHLVVKGLPEEGTVLLKEQEIGKLGAPNSYDSGYNRKHLHLGIRKGTRLDMRGYVQEEADLRDFIDPASVLPL